MHIDTNIAGCSLRAWEKEDKPALVRNANNRKVWRNLTDAFPHPYTEADADFWITTANQATPIIHFAIDLEGAAVGGIGVIADEGIARHTGQFGYWLGETYWGKGIATAAARAMVAHAFSSSLFQRLEASVFAWNPASMRVLEKVGFIRESVTKRSVFKDDQFTDCVIYALTKKA
ncbi:MAG: GNAT family N-acetyltransferase [Polaromonas sp.]|uniref:GNAT family N-acetyltransferase n=1 Tax=Polaromonas sp. TaxID=1869339 RepID=UPI00178F80AB|nr:GNAT family protein [Polaromonas sp.]NMM10755.1 GNAT family N-acetyltransferase [Polaromonas sp.]